MRDIARSDTWWNLKEVQHSKQNWKLIVARYFLKLSIILFDIEYLTLIELLSKYILVIVIIMYSFFTLKQSQKSMQLITKNSATLKTTGCCPFLCMATHCYRISVCVCVLYKIYFVNCPRSSHKDLFCQMMVRHWGILKKPNSNILWYSIKSIQYSCKKYTV